MKKRLLCIVVAILMVLPVLLASCGKEDEKDKMKDIILGTDSDKPIDRAYTLSLWIPTDAITVKGMTADLSELTQQQKQDLLNHNPAVYEFLKRVDDVEDAINEVLIGRSFYTKIDIVPVNNEYYEETIANKFASIDKEINPGDMNNKGLDTAYENEIAEEVVGNKVIYDLLYRPVDKNQLDIFLIRDYGEYDGYAQYLSYANKGYLLALNDANTNYVAPTGTYASIIKLIRDPFLQQMKINDKIYALPNNHLYADQYQYILVNKELLSETSFDIADMKDFYSCIDFINAVGEKGADGVVPFVGNYNDIANYIYVDRELGINGTVTYKEVENSEAKEETAEDGKEDTKEKVYEKILGIQNIFESEEFTNFVKQYKSLEDKGYVKTEASDGEIAAVKILNGTSLEADEYSDEYYVIETAVPVANTEDIFASMFAISTFSLNYDRSMKILNLLQSDSEIRTLLQYGIKGEDYTTVTEVINGVEVEKINIKEDTYYKMNSLYTGNQYYTYPGNNTTIDDWDYVKKTNLNTVVNPFIKFDYLIKNGKLSDEDRAFLNENRAKYVDILRSAYAKIENMTLAEYELFMETYNANFDSLANDLANIKKDIESVLNIDSLIETKKQEIAFEQELLNNDAGYQDLLTQLEQMKNRREEIQKELDAGDKTNENEYYDLGTKITMIGYDISNYESNLSDLKDEYDRLVAEKETAPEKIQELQSEYDSLETKINTMKTVYSEAYALSNDADYAKLVNIYKELLKQLK